MDPFTLLKTLWRHKFVALPCLLLGILGAVYIVIWGPRTYESTAVYVVVNPDPPSDREIVRKPSLGRLNDNNPYLRSPDPSLIVKVLISKLSAQSTAMSLEEAGLSTDYRIDQSSLSQMTLVISTASESPEVAVATRDWLITGLTNDLYDLQKINDADDRFLFTALPVDVSVEPVEKVSSRLRALILVGAASGILLIGAVSVAVGVERRRSGLVAAPAVSAAVAAPPPTDESSAAIPTRDAGRRATVRNHPDRRSAIVNDDDDDEPQPDLPRNAGEESLGADAPVGKLISVRRRRSEG